MLSYICARLFNVYIWCFITTLSGKVAIAVGQSKRPKNHLEYNSALSNKFNFVVCQKQFAK